MRHLNKSEKVKVEKQIAKGREAKITKRKVEAYKNFLEELKLLKKKTLGE